MRAALILAGIGAAALPVWAETAPEPPLWAYLAECGAVFEAAASVGDSYSGAKPEDIARAAEVGELFLAEAVEEAGASGQTDPEGDVASIMGYLRERWQTRTSDLFSARSNLKWFAYCGRLARQRGILPLPG
jgi:hypothetical protein